MKRISALAIVLVLIIVGCLFACHHKDDAQPVDPPAGTTEEAEQDIDTEEEGTEVDQAEGSGSEGSGTASEKKADEEKSSSKASDKQNNTDTASGGKTSTASSSKTGSRTSSSTTASSGKKSGTATTQKPSGSVTTKPAETTPTPTPAPEPQPEPQPVDPVPAVQDRMNWPDNEYTAVLPKPSAGTVQKTDMQDGVYCLLLTGADMSDVKAYASTLINAGYTNEVTETVESGTYLFGGGNAGGSFVVVSYQNGQFIIGVQP